MLCCVYAIYYTHIYTFALRSFIQNVVVLSCRHRGESAKRDNNSFTASSSVPTAVYEAISQDHVIETFYANRTLLGES